MTEPPSSFDDVRGRGFAARTPLADAWAWIDAHTMTVDGESLTPGPALAGRVLAADVAAPGPLPPWTRAAGNGVAVAAGQTLGAGAYNPVRLDQALAVSSGDPLPPWADAVLPYEGIDGAPPLAVALMPVPPGEGVERAGDGVAAGAAAAAAGRVVRPADIGLLAVLGVARVSVVRRPRVRVVLAGGPRGGGAEADGALLAALVARDGGDAVLCGPLPADAAVLAGAIAAPRETGPPADAVLVVGRTGLGADDVAPAALAMAGRLHHHGMALRPGGSAGLGVVAAGVPVVLLPGEPGACLAAYDLLAGRVVRRLAGRDGDPPYRIERARTARKLVSEIGVADLYRVRRLDDGRITPLASAAVAGLAAAAAADGAVLIPADSEGIPAAAEVAWWCYG